MVPPSTSPPSTVLLRYHSSNLGYAGAGRRFHYAGEERAMAKEAPVHWGSMLSSRWRRREFPVLVTDPLTATGTAVSLISQQGGSDGTAGTTSPGSSRAGRWPLARPGEVDLCRLPAPPRRRPALRGHPRLPLREPSPLSHPPAHVEPAQQGAGSLRARSWAGGSLLRSF